MAPLVQRQAVELAAQRQADEIPRARRLTAAVKEEDRRSSSHAPVDVVEAHAVQDDVVLHWDDELLDVEARQSRRELLMLDLVLQCHLTPPDSGRPACARPRP